LLYRVDKVGNKHAKKFRVRKIYPPERPTTTATDTHPTLLAPLTEHTLAEVTAFAAYTLHWFAPAISRWVLPTLSLKDAAHLAEALVIVERLTGMFSGESGGKSCDVGNLTALERQACQLTARLWREWPKDLDSGSLLSSANPKPSYLERRQAVMESAPTVAA